MGYIKTDGIIIREVDTGEADKVVTILTRTMGKVSAFAKNSRRPRSSLVAGTQYLCLCNFILFKGKDLHSLSSCEVIEPYYQIRCDVVKLTYAAHILEMVNDVVQEEQPSSRTFQLLCNTLHMISKTEKELDLIARIFEFRFLSILGYAPYVKGCIKCGTDRLDGTSFSFKKCGLLCNDCISEDFYSSNISPGAIKSLRYIIHCSSKELFNFNVSESVLDELNKISKRFIKDRLEKDYNKLDFLKSL